MLGQLSKRAVGNFSRAATKVAKQQPKANASKWVAAGVLGGATAASLALGAAHSSGDVLEAPHYPWNHNGMFASFDAAALRRGYEVYRNVCATCHSLELICFRNLVGNSHTEAQAKALANSIEVTDGPNDQGEMFQRKGALSDALPSPYPNDEYARYINGGALPPDLSLMAKARHHGDNYIMALLTGYRDPPAGVELRDGLHYNPYFDGGAISMAKALFDGAVDYEDGTPATESQMAKDVAIFLKWCAEPEHDERKQAGIKFLTAATALAALTGYYKRAKWNIFKTRRITYPRGFH